MTIRDIDLHNMPMWFVDILTHIEDYCERELRAESPQYASAMKERMELLEQYRFISRLTDGDKVEQNLHLNGEELNALSRYLDLDADRRELESVEMYLLGARHMYELLLLLKIIK